MVRRLHPDEDELWARVAASIRPLPGRTRPLPGPVIRPIAEAAPARPEPPKRTPLANRVAVDAATLDASWDRKLRTGRLVPDLTIDLHGFTSLRAHAELVRRIEDAALSGARVLLVITGKGARSADDGGRLSRDRDVGRLSRDRDVGRLSRDRDVGHLSRDRDGDRPRGVIRASLRDWLHAADLRPFVAALRPAHPRHGGGGAWYVILRRR